MDCRECTENLTAYMDDELSPAGSAQMRAHLETCVSCTTELRGFKEAANFVQSHARDREIRPESWNAIYDRIHAKRSVSPFGFLLPKWSQLLATAAVVAAFAIGYLWYQHDQRRSLDEYISQYIKTREAGFSLQIREAGFNLRTMNSFIPNPFAEAKPAPDTNPFRLEDR